MTDRVVGELTVKVNVDASQLTTALDKTKTASQQTAAVATTGFKGVEQSFDKAGVAADRLGDKYQRFQKQMDVSTAAMRSHITGLDNTKKAMGDVASKVSAGAQALDALSGTLPPQIAMWLRLAPAAAAAATAIGGVYASLKAVGAASDLKNLSEDIGVTVEDLSKLEFLAGKFGISMGNVEMSIRAMQRAISEAAAGSKAFQDRFTNLGLSVERLQSVDAVTAFGEISDAINRLSNASDRTAASQELLGRSARRMGDLIRAGSQGLREGADEAKAYGAVLSSSMAEAADELQKKLNAMVTGMVGALNNTLLTMLQTIGLLNSETTKMPMTDNERLGIAIARWKDLEKQTEKFRINLQQSGVEFKGLQSDVDKMLDGMKKVKEESKNIFKDFKGPAPGAASLGSSDFAKDKPSPELAEIDEAIVRTIEDAQKLDKLDMSSGIRDAVARMNDLAKATHDAKVKVGELMDEAQKEYKPGSSVPDPVEWEKYYQAISEMDKKQKEFRVANQEKLNAQLRSLADTYLVDHSQRTAEAEANDERVVEQGLGRKAGRQADYIKMMRGINDQYYQSQRTNMESELADLNSKYKDKWMMSDTFYAKLAEIETKYNDLNAARKEKEVTLLDKEYKDGLIKYEEYLKKKQELEQKYAAITVATNKGVSAAGAANWQDQLREAARYGEGAASIMGSLASVMDESNKKQFEAAKALRIGQAIVSTAAGIARAFADYAYPLNLVAAAVAAAAGAAQIAQIARTKYKGGAQTPSASAGGSAPSLGGKEAQSPQTATNVNVTLVGDRFSQQQLRGMIGAINNAAGDNMNIVVGGGK